MAYIPYPNYYPQMYQQNVNNERLAYLQQYQQQIPQAQPMQTATQSFNQGLLWVQGEAGAKSYMVAPGTTVLLMDSEAQRFYIKSVDGNGVPAMRIFDYKEVLQEIIPPVVAEAKEPEYATHEEIENLRREFAELKSKLEVNHESFIQPTRRKSKQNDESGTNEDGD